MQIHNLPVFNLKREIAVALGNTIGEVMKSTEIDDEVGGGRTLRIRVKVNISNPLC